MASLSVQCKNTIDGMDPNNNFTMKSYSLRPRGGRRSEEPTLEEVPRPSRTKRKSKSVPLSKYRRKTANARERSRMREINEAFETLRRVIPQMTSSESHGEKLTKISTLRLAMKYISALSNLLQDRDVESDGESFLGDYALSVTSPESQDGLTTATILGDAPTACADVPLPFVDPFEGSTSMFDSSYLLEDAPLFLMEFS